MLINFVRAIIIYIVVLIVMRVMGKREVGQLQTFEFVIAIMIADVATIPMSEVGIPIINGIVPIFGLLVMHIFISYINMKSIKMRGLICGKPSILINKGRIDENAMIRERYTINELQEKLRALNIDSIKDVEYAILETNGQLSVIEKTEKRGAKPEDFGIIPEYEGMTYDLVIDGVVMNENLKIINKDYMWLVSEMKKYNIKPEDALLITINEKNDIFYQVKELKRGKSR